jgi:hypothetical protein
MAFDGNNWSLVQSEDLPKGLSDREDRDLSSDETLSISGPERSRVAWSYFTRMNVKELERIRDRYQIPDDIALHIPDLDERACSSKFDDVAFFEADFQAGLRFLMQPFIMELLDHLCFSPGQLAPNA